MKKGVVFTIVVFVMALLLVIGVCLIKRNGEKKPYKDMMTDNTNLSSETMKDEFLYINSDGNTLETRIKVPDGFQRIKNENGSFAQFLRDYPLKPDQSSVLLYNGEMKKNQNAHIAVFRLPIEEEDLQQCADSVMRMYGEYYYEKQDYSKIIYTLGGGFVADFSKWSQGNGIRLSGEKLEWTISENNDTSYESFQRFMRMVFAYSGTMNMEDDSYSIEPEEIKAGDIFIHGGSPGHVVMIVDVCENAKGEKAFLLAQGYMPAQEFHILKNPLHDSENNPWYYEKELCYPFHTPEYTFEEESLKRYKLAE